LQVVILFKGDSAKCEVLETYKRSPSFSFSHFVITLIN